MTRKLTDAEADAFDGCEDHKNPGGEIHCCPHCLEGSDISVFAPYDDPDVVECPKCGMEFIAWTVTAPVACSAKLPLPDEDDEHEAAELLRRDGEEMLHAEYLSKLSA